MQNNKMIKWLILAAIVIGFITCWFLCHPGNVCHPRAGGDLITIHDTIKSSSVQYKILPGVNYNIDSLTNSINQFWKDSLKSLYGKGLFQSRFTKTDDLGTRTYTLDSRIPIDPESQLIIDESFTFPKRTFGLIAALGSSAALGLKYYFHDSPKFSFSGQFGGEYKFAVKDWNYNALLELEYKF